MAKDMREYNRKYYAEHKDIWGKNYAANAETRRENARVYANKKWESDPEYRAAHTKRTIENSKMNRRCRSLAMATEKLYRACQKIFVNFTLP